MQNKFAEQLTLDLAGVVRRDVAQKVHISDGQLTRLANGQRTSDKGMRAGLAHALHSILLAFSGARKDYGVLSFLKSSKRYDDVMATLFQQRKEEDDRRALEEAFDQAMTTKPEARSSQQILLIRDYFKEYAEEIMSENTDIVAKAEYAGIDIHQVFDEANARVGG
ncbi:transcriptional regulator [Levilactobacillus wangkuiensis]|uniref:transcriptional regulator n=1 Tax=Levilactobacillus wangkuiensis TaxID=2799566 RepID=UPI0019434EFD|nr:transcriptional regulator [Levilactobacillus wangkuiensis]